MPLFGRTDNYQDKPKFPVERFDYGKIRLYSNGASLGATVIPFPQNSTIKLAVGYMANGVNVGGAIGTSGFNLINGPVIASLTSNSVTLSTGVVGNIAVGGEISFSAPMLPWNGHSANSYNANTIFVTASRMKTSNHWSNVSVTAPGHVHVKVGSGGRHGRIQTETLVCLSNGVAYNATSGGPYYTGV